MQLRIKWEHAWG